MQQTINSRGPVGILFVLEWVLATVLGWLIGTFINARSYPASGSGPGPLGDLSELGIWVVYGAAIGCAQWFVVRKQLHDAGWWIAASIFGAALGWLVVKVFSMVEWAGAAQGALVGAMQYMVLQNQVRHARWWIIVSALSWAMGWLWAIMMSSTLGPTMEEGMNWALPGIAYGIVSGTISGILLVFMLRHPARRAASA